MIYCVTFADFEIFLTTLGFVQATQTERTVVFMRAGEAVTVRRPNAHGDITETAALAACDAAGLTPPGFDVHWCD